MQSVLQPSRLFAQIRPNLAYVAWFQVLVATLGSLYFSEVMKLPPCMLCWYQRIFMYPLVYILAVAIVTVDRRLKFYCLPLTITGILIASYHNLLYYHVIPESIVPCTAGISCTTRQIEWLGFITIPLLSLMAFTITTIALIFYKKEEKDEDV
ncbi:MAG: disulfide bond formation protein B [Caldilineaceae bacterium]|nr:disulfide bond formation protein B [Caldilineaceae bacterium]